MRAACLVLVLLSCVVDAKKAKKAQNIGKVRSSGDMAFAKGDMAKAKKMFTKVIKLEPNNERNYYKRFRVFLKERKYNEAIGDLTAALEVNPKYKEGLFQRGKVYKTMGKCEESYADLSSLLSLDPSHKKATAELPAAQQCAEQVRTAHKHKAAGNHHQAHVHYSKALEHTTGSISLNMARAQCSFEMGEYFEVLADTGRALKIEKENIESLMLRGDAYYRLGEFDMGMRHYRQGLHYDPEHKQCKAAYRRLKKLQKFEKNGDDEASGGKYKEAVESYLKAIDVDPGHLQFGAKTYLKICEGQIKSKDAPAALAAAQEAINRDANFAPAYACKSDAHLVAEEWQEAVNAARAATEKDGEDRSLKEKLQKAEAALKQSKQKNYYKILDVPRDADKKTLKKAYRKLALMWHPDKHPGEDKQKEAANKFAEIGEAYEVLTDEEKRAKYDKGEDVFDNQGGGGGQPRHMFHHGGQQFHFNFGM